MTRWRRRCLLGVPIRTDWWAPPVRTLPQIYSPLPCFSPLLSCFSPSTPAALPLWPCSPSPLCWLSRCHPLLSTLVSFSSPLVSRSIASSRTPGSAPQRQAKMPGLTAPSDYAEELPRHPALKINSKVSACPLSPRPTPPWRFESDWVCGVANRADSFATLACPVPIQSSGCVRGLLRRRCIGRLGRRRLPAVSATGARANPGRSSRAGAGGARGPAGAPHVQLRRPHPTPPGGPLAALRRRGDLHRVFPRALRPPSPRSRQGRARALRAGGGQAVAQVLAAPGRSRFSHIRGGWNRGEKQGRMQSI